MSRAEVLFSKHQRSRNQLARLCDGSQRVDTLPDENNRAHSANISLHCAFPGLERDGMYHHSRGRGTFVPEAAMHQLKSGLDVFALLAPDTRGGFYPSLQRGFHEASAERHNQVIISDTNNDPLRQADVVLQLMDKQVAGIAMVPTTSPQTPAHQIRPIQMRGIPIVFCHRRVEGIQAPLVTFAVPEVGRQAGRAMLEAGHKRVAMISGQRAGLSSQYEQGLREVMREGGGDLPEALVCYGNGSKNNAEHEHFLESGLKHLLRLSNRPTAIFCTFDSDAELAYLTLQSMGVNVPGDISIVGFGGTWRNSAITRRLTSVAVDEEELGRNAVKLLDEMRSLERPHDDMSEIVLPVILSGGETLGPVPTKIK